MIVFAVLLGLLAGSWRRPGLKESGRAAHAQPRGHQGMAY
jgi:hypothetical protein